MLRGITTKIPLKVEYLADQYYSTVMVKAASTYGAAYEVLMATTPAILHTSILIPENEGGTFKVRIWFRCAGAAANAQGQVHVDESVHGVETDVNCLPTETMDLIVGTATREYHQDSSSSFVCVGNSNLRVYWSKIANNGAGTLAIYRIELIRQ